MTVRQFRELGEVIRPATLKSLGRTVEGLRARKSAWEIEKIRAALSIAERAFEAVRGLMRPGVTELAVAVELELAMRLLGAEGPAFPTIVAGGPRAALPHARPTGRKFRPGETIIIDWGARLDGYNSDLTRTLVLDRMTRRIRGMLDAVRAAQERALRRIRPGVGAREVDRGAREFLRSRRRGKYFVHGTGHGVGLEIHEGPSLSPRSDDTLRMGMVITVEPGVYVPGVGGVRLESMVVVSRSGCRILDKLPIYPPHVPPDVRRVRCD